MKQLIKLSITVCLFFLFTSHYANAQLLNTSGKISLLRIHDVGTKYGPPNDQIDSEVIFQLDSQPTRAFGFQLRDNNNKLVHQGMVDLLRDALANNFRVHVDYNNIPGKNYATIIRVWITKN